MNQTTKPCNHTPSCHCASCWEPLCDYKLLPLTRYSAEIDLDEMFNDGDGHPHHWC